MVKSIKPYGQPFWDSDWTARKTIKFVCVLIFQTWVVCMKAMTIEEKRERVFIVLSSIFFVSMAMLNIIGLTRFVQLGPLALAVGVLPYPMTFLVTDIVSEIYGRSRANFIVWVGLLLNFFVFFVLFLGQWLEPVPLDIQPSWQVLSLSEPVFLPNGQILKGSVELFSIIYACTSGSIVASLLAYSLAQFFDIRIFHYLKKKTKGKALWLRNNVSTLISQGIDSFIVVAVTFGVNFMNGKIGFKEFFILFGSNYLFKMIVALLDTIPFYLVVRFLQGYLKI